MRAPRNIDSYLLMADGSQFNDLGWSVVESRAIDEAIYNYIVYGDQRESLHLVLTKEIRRLQALAFYNGADRDFVDLLEVRFGRCFNERIEAYRNLKEGKIE